MSEKKRKSKSLEEISNISSTVIDLERAHTTRLSVQLPQSQTQQNFRHTQSHNYGRSKKLLPPTIAEGDSYEDSDGPRKLKIIDENGEIVENRSSQRSKTSGRSRSGSNTSKKRQTTYDNQAFDGTLDSISIKSSRSVERDQNVTQSGMSSTRTSSVQSLEVQREQYWCFSKWSPCERKLAAVVAILATIIIILVVVVAILAGNDRVVPKRISMVS